MSSNAHPVVVLSSSPAERRSEPRPCTARRLVHQSRSGACVPSDREAFRLAFRAALGEAHEATRRA